MTDPNPTPAPSVAFDQWREAERENLIAAGLGNTTVHVLRIAFLAGWSAALARPSPSVERRDEIIRLILELVWSPISGPVVWTADLRVASIKQTEHLADAILALVGASGKA